MRCKSMLVIALVLCAEEARGAFVNGVERFDGTVKDTTTWAETPASPATQNNALTIPWTPTFSSYTAYSFALGVGQGVRAKMMMPRIDPTGVQTYLLLSDRSGGMSVPAFLNDSNFVGISANWNGVERTTIYGMEGGLVGGVNFQSGLGSNVVQLAGNHSGELFTVEVDRLDKSNFRFSAWDSSNVLLGTSTNDVTVPLFPGALTLSNVPANLYIVLTGSATWDDVTIVAVPEAGSIAAWAMSLALLVNRRRAR